MKKIISLLIFLSVISVNFACRQKARPGAGLRVTEEEKFNHFLDSLKQSGSPEIQKLNEIRRYLAQRIDLGNSEDSLAFNYHKIPWEELSAFHCIELFEQDSLTAQCGLSSYILAKLYNHAGYEAYTYSCGYDHTKLSHEFVLVKLNGKLIVEDAFFALTITDNDNNPIDFLQLLPMIKEGNFSGIHLVEEDVLSEGWLTSQAELDSLLTAYEPFYESYNESYRNHVKEVTVTGNRVKILLDRNYYLYSTPLLVMMQPQLKEEGLGENFLSIYLKPLHIRNGSTGLEDDSLKKLISSIVLN